MKRPRTEGMAEEGEMSDNLHDAVEALLPRAEEAAWHLERLLHLAPEDTTAEDRRAANLACEMLLAELRRVRAALVQETKREPDGYVIVDVDGHPLDGSSSRRKDLLDHTLAQAKRLTGNISANAVMPFYLGTPPTT